MRPIDQRALLNVVANTGKIVTVLALVYAPVILADYGLNKARIEGVDTSKWACKFCPKEEGTSGYLEGFAGYSDDDISSRFKRTEAEGDQAQVALSAGIVKNNASEQFQLSADGLGNDNAGGIIGYNNYDGTRLNLDYSRSTRYSGEGAETLYLDSKSNTLELPPAWVTQSNTGAMDFSSLYGVPSFQQRDTVDAEVRSMFGEDALALSVRYRHQLRSGTHWTSGSILNDVIALPDERDDRTRDLTVNASVPFSYQTGTGAAGLEYFKSEYENDRQSLSWENPFTAGIAGANQGRMALSPDNQYQQWRLFANYGLKQHRFNLSYSQGRGEQDDIYLPYTTNALLATQVLPKNSYDGEVETRHARLAWGYRINPQWNLTSRYRFNERENVSDVLEYEPVLTDSLVQGQIENQRYSHKKSQLDIELDWHLRPQSRLGYSYEYESFKRTRDSTGEYQSHSLEFSWKESWSPDVKTRAKLIAEDREQQDSGADVSAGDNLYYRDFSVADRLRNGINFDLDWQSSSEVLLTANASFQNDDYDKTQIGVKETKEKSLGININWQLKQDLSVNSSLQRSWMSWLMAGSAQQSVPTWDSKQEDQYDVFTSGIRRSGLNDGKLTVGANYVFVASRGKTDLSVSGKYDDLHSHAHTLQTYLDYAWQPNWQLRFEALYERYESVDPSLIAVNSLAKVVGSAIQDEDYSEWLFGMRIRYQIPE